MTSLTEQRLAKLLELQDTQKRYELVQREAQKRHHAEWRANPTKWVETRLDEHVWSKQDEIMHALTVHDLVAVRSCHGVGKSHIASRIVAWWIDTHTVGEAFVVTTAPTATQVRIVLWRYINQVHKKAKLPGKCNQVEWNIDNEPVAIGRKPADHDEGAFQGLHADEVLIVLDEACGIPEQLWVAASTLATNKGCKILAIGNPDDPSSHFAKVCSPTNELWHTIGISAFDSPNFTGESVPEVLSKRLISTEWVEARKKEWGEDNPLYKAKVLGEFSVDDQWSVVRQSDVYHCSLGRDTVWTPEQLTPIELGVDVGGGGDETVIRERRGPLACREWREHTDKPQVIAPLILNAIRETGAVRVKVDSIGVGFGVCGELENMRQQGLHNADIVMVNVAEKSRHPEKYANVRAEMWWEIGRLLSEKRDWDLSQYRSQHTPGMDNSESTIAQLLDPKWELNSRGQILIEKKDDIRKRLGRSPDNADALLMAFYTPPNVGGMLDWFRNEPGNGPSWAGLTFGKAA